MTVMTVTERVDHRGGQIETLIPSGKKFIVGYTPSRLPEFTVIPPSYWQPPDSLRQLAPKETVHLVTQVRYNETNSVPVTPKMDLYRQRLITWDEALTPDTKPKTGYEWVQRYETERSAVVEGVNLTIGTRPHSGVSFLATPSVELSKDKVLLQVKDIEPTNASNFFKKLGKGAKNYTVSHPDVELWSAGVTYGHWKSINREEQVDDTCKVEEGPVHFQITACNANDIAQSRIQPVSALDNDIYRLYTNNIAGIMTANTMQECCNFDTQFHLQVARTKIQSSGALSFVVNGKLESVLQNYGTELWTYLEEEMNKGWLSTIAILAMHDSSRSYEYLRNSFCGAIAMTQNTKENNFLIQIATGMRMSPKVKALGGIFAAKGIWVARKGVSSSEEGTAFHDRTNEFIQCVAA